MPRTFIVGFDGSDAAHAAVRFAKTLAAAADGEVVAATVFRPVPRIFGKGSSAAADAALEGVIWDEATDRLRAVEDDVVRTVTTEDDSPVSGLRRLAAEVHEPVVVVGATHRGRLGRVLPGSTSEQLLHNASSPVVVVPAEWTDTPIQTVGVAFDGQSASRIALQAAEQLARQLGARVVVIAVDDGDLTAKVFPSPTALRDREQARQELEQLVEGAVAGLHPSVAGEARLLSGVPGPTLAAAAHDVDLLVMGSRGHGSLRSALEGGVSRHVVDHAPCPVMVTAVQEDVPLAHADASRPAAAAHAPRLVVGYDGSSASREALAVAARSAGPAGTVYVVVCFEEPPSWMGGAERNRALFEAQVEPRGLVEALALVPALEHTIWESELLPGPAADAILRVADVRDADEIVIASHGRGRSASLLGSVSHAVLRGADRPVRVITDKTAERLAEAPAAQAHPAR